MHQRDMALAKKIKCLKYLVYSYVILLTVTGAAQVIIGTSLLWGHVGYYSVVQNKLWVPSAIMLSLGPFTFILCWMGCQATNQRKRCLLAMFSVLLIAAICVQFVVCGWAFAMRENLPTSVEIYVDDSFVEFLDKFSRTKVDNLHLWNRMQSQLQCCGVDGPLDYRRLSLPWSCCSRPEHAYESACDTHYKRGCLAVLSEQIKIRLLLAAFANAGIALAQSIGLFCVIHLTVVLGKCEIDEHIHPVTKRNKEIIPMSAIDRKQEAACLSLSPSQNRRLVKISPPPPASSLAK